MDLLKTTIYHQLSAARTVVCSILFACVVAIIYEKIQKNYGRSYAARMLGHEEGRGACKKPFCTHEMGSKAYISLALS
jgi:hypothetical protein